jgi:predicted small metal-binding protein
MKNLHCSDAGFDCKGVITGKSEEEVLQLAAIHAKEVHGVTVTAEIAEKLKTLIKDDETKGNV